MLTDEPTVKKSNMESDAPNSALDLTDSDDPKDTNFNTDKAEPKREHALKDIELPSVRVVKIDDLHPILTRFVTLK
jgi:hypothetical protein